MKEHRSRHRDEDEDEFEPRRQKKKRKRSSSGGALKYILLGLFVFLVLVGGGAGVYLLAIAPANAKEEARQGAIGKWLWIRPSNPDHKLELDISDREIAKTFFISGTPRDVTVFSWEVQKRKEDRMTVRVRRIKGGFGGPSGEMTWVLTPKPPDVLFLDTPADNCNLKRR